MIIMQGLQESPVVTHLTRVSLTLAADPDCCRTMLMGGVDPATVRALGRLAAERAERVAAMMDLMAKWGFTFKAGKNVVYCYSNTIEAGEIKKVLLAEGFKDREFQIVLEYTRGWGML